MDIKILTNPTFHDTHPPSDTSDEWAYSTLSQCQVIRRNGQLVSFNAEKISAAMRKTFLAVEGHAAQNSNRINQLVQQLTQQVVKGISRHLKTTGKVHIEDIQDQVELALMRAGEHSVARAYVLYREEHAKLRAENHELPQRHVTDSRGNLQVLDESRLRLLVTEACTDLADVHAEIVVTESLKSLFDGIPETQVNQALVVTARTLIEKEPNYTYVAARLLLDKLRHEALSFVLQDNIFATATEMHAQYPNYFKQFIATGVAHELLNPQLQQFDLERLSHAIHPDRDLQFTYLGLQTLYDRYFLHWQDTRFELPQVFFMRVAMGLALHEADKEARAIEFYHLISRFDFMCSTPTLFNAGTLHPQLSSCFVSTIPDDLEGIFGAIRDNALMQKWAGGLGNDWTNVRGMGALIKGTNGQSQGVVPFMKVANDTLVAVNQCFAPDTAIFTADGIKPIKDVKKGDLVLGQRGAYREVLENFAYLHQRDDMVELTVKHAITPLQVSAGHPFFAIQNVPMEQAISRTQAQLAAGKIYPAWVEVGQLQKGDYVAQVIPQEIVPVAELTEDDAHLYGILLGDGHCSRHRQEWGVCGNPKQDSHLEFVRNYLTARKIHFWEAQRNAHFLHIRWSYSAAVQRCGTTGQFVGAGAPVLPFSRDDLYTNKGEKHIARRFAHLPHAQTLALLQGLLETNGGISRGKEIYFTTSSLALAEGVRYQCLRLGIATAGQKRLRDTTHDATRVDGTPIKFEGESLSYDIRIPAVPQLAERVGCRSLTKYNWFIHQNHLFSRVRACQPTAMLPVIYDLKVEGDESYMTSAALAHNGGRRRGSGCAYLESWHIDIEEFLELRKNTGDERRRTHDMNTANWIPDVFMERVHENREWTLFSPDEVPELHDLYGIAFKIAYENYERLAQTGKIRIFKPVSAVELWRKMLTMLFETGHAWIAFKDAFNLRNPQQHCGVIHSSNLCTEIGLNTKAYADAEHNKLEGEVAVCNLGSINLAAHVTQGQLDTEKLQQTIKTALRMLDNVIDINHYAIPQARNANLKHRPVGLGIMGFQDALYQLRISYASEQAIDVADNMMEFISYYTILASTDLAQERGQYSSFEGSLWSQGILPIDSIAKLQAARGEYLELNTQMTLDWATLRDRVKRVGMRNSNCMALAPTATISNICGVSQSIEPTYQNLFVKSNLSGEFTVINPYLVRDLKALGLWDEVMVNDLKYFDGSLQPIERVPETLKQLYATAFEIDASWLVEAGARRQKWIDQAQSLNLYMKEPSGRKLDALYKLAWVRGLKTTYYLRSLGATHLEKNTVDGMGARASVYPETTLTVVACNIDDTECESCQ
jgi:ribonucleoside-diphosphate reductase alpha chain